MAARVNRTGESAMIAARLTTYPNDQARRRCGIPKPRFRSGVYSITSRSNSAVNASEPVFSAMTPARIFAGQRVMFIG